MNKLNNENEYILNCNNLRKNLKRNLDNLSEFKNSGSLSSIYTFDPNKRRHNIDLKDEIKNSETIEIISCLNRKNKRKLENFTEKQNKKIFTETQKNYFLNDTFSRNNLPSATSNLELDEINNKSVKNSLRNNNELLSENKIEENKKNSMELAIIPFEGNISTSSDNKYENSITLKSSDLKNILSLLSKKNIVYKNLKSRIKNNKPLMINCKNLNILLDKCKYENEIGRNFHENQNTIDIHDNYELENNLLNNSIILYNNSTESIGLNDADKNENNFCLNNKDLLNTKLDELHINLQNNNCDIDYILSSNSMNNVNNANKGTNFDILNKNMNTENNLYSLNGAVEDIKNLNEINYMNNNYNNISNTNISNNTIRTKNDNLGNNNIFRNLRTDDNFNILHNESNFRNLNYDNNFNNLRSNDNLTNLSYIDNCDNLNNNCNIYNMIHLNNIDNSNNNICNLDNIRRNNNLYNLNNANIQSNINNFNNMNNLNNFNNFNNINNFNNTNELNNMNN